MPRYIKKVAKTLGLPPGTMIHVGETRQAKPRITVFDYDLDHYEEKVVKSIEETFPYRDKKTTTWINIDGIHDLELIKTVDSHFGIHPLVLEDIVNASQRPKKDDYGDYIYIVVKMFFIDPQKDQIASEQISLILGKGYVISFQETEGDIFDPIRDRIRNKKGWVRLLGADYLAYALLDTIVDNYFIILERMGGTIDELETGIMAEDNTAIPREIHKMKNDIIYLRKHVWPLREVIGSLERTESKLVLKETTLYLRDLYDHVIQTIDTIETFRDLLSSLHDVYLSSVSHKTNEVIKILTIFTTMFSPLTFIVGVYGMNFKHMPELNWQHGYFLLWIAMLSISLAMFGYFRRKKWI